MQLINRVSRKTAKLKFTNPAFLTFFACFVYFVCFVIYPSFEVLLS